MIWKDWNDVKIVQSQFSKEITGVSHLKMIEDALGYKWIIDEDIPTTKLFIFDKNAMRDFLTDIAEEPNI
jgi:hypothetical protein